MTQIKNSDEYIKPYPKEEHEFNDESIKNMIVRITATLQKVRKFIIDKRSTADNTIPYTDGRVGFDPAHGIDEKEYHKLIAKENKLRETLIQLDQLDELFQ